jgi:hypothetical protein
MEFLLRLLSTQMESGLMELKIGVLTNGLISSKNMFDPSIHASSYIIIVSEILLFYAIFERRFRYYFSSFNFTIEIVFIVS